MNLTLSPWRIPRDYVNSNRETARRVGFVRRGGIGAGALLDICTVRLNVAERSVLSPKSRARHSRERIQLRRLWRFGGIGCSGSKNVSEEDSMSLFGRRLASRMQADIGSIKPACVRIALSGHTAEGWYG